MITSEKDYYRYELQRKPIAHLKKIDTEETSNQPKLDRANTDFKIFSESSQNFTNKICSLGSLPPEAGREKLERCL